MVFRDLYGFVGLKGIIEGEPAVAPCFTRRVSGLSTSCESGTGYVKDFSPTLEETGEKAMSTLEEMARQANIL